MCCCHIRGLAFCHFFQSLEVLGSQTGLMVAYNLRLRRFAVCLPTISFVVLISVFNKPRGSHSLLLLGVSLRSKCILVF